MVRRRVSILVSVCPAGATDGGRKLLRWWRALVRSLILSFSFSLAFCLCLLGFLERVLVLGLPPRIFDPSHRLGAADLGVLKELH